MPGGLITQDFVVAPGVANLIIRSLLDRQQHADPLGEADRLAISSAATAWPAWWATATART